MTTPEKFRRRQRVEGALLLALAFTTIIYGVWDSGQSRDRDRCMAESFRSAGHYQVVRAELAEESTNLRLRVDDLQSRVFTSFERGTTADEFYTVLEDFQDKYSELEAEQRALLKERKRANPPEFPDGKCE